MAYAMGNDWLGCLRGGNRCASGTGKPQPQPAMAVRGPSLDRLSPRCPLSNIDGRWDFTLQSLLLKNHAFSRSCSRRRLSMYKLCQYLWYDTGCIDPHLAPGEADPTPVDVTAGVAGKWVRPGSAPRALNETTQSAVTSERHACRCARLLQPSGPMCRRRKTSCDVESKTFT
jgi:hypothetical protein